MWICPKCNDYLDDRADTCAKCAEGPRNVSESKVNSSNQQIEGDVSTSTRVITYFGLMAAAMVISFPNPKGILFIPAFP